jgi:phosphoribosylformylglycinamidine synthase subunit PurSL
VTLWQIDILPGTGQPDRSAASLTAECRSLGLPDNLQAATARGFLLEGELDEQQALQLARQVLIDTLTERAVVARVADDVLLAPPAGYAGSKPQLVHVLPKPGVMDPVAISTQRVLVGSGYPVDQVRTFRKFWIEGLVESQLERLSQKVLSNDSIEQVVIGPLQLIGLAVGAPYRFVPLTTPISSLDDERLMELSRRGQLYLSLAEMQVIQRHYSELGREPTDIELETIAQTWSEHCSHKTLAGRIAYRDPDGPRQFDNMLKETIFAATQQIRQQLGADDWCVKVFSDNAGIIRFDERDHVVFKVETHNHPSAIEPYGGANTGLGGVIRDPLGTGLGAKPVCSTDVFCFAPPDTPATTLPPGVLHPRRVMHGVVAGVRDYGNRMGIPTVNGAVYFDPAYLGNPLVYCGNVGLLPVDKVEKAPQPGDWIVAVGGRTGRDGIHGATFSSVELTEESESISGGAVQIGNPITEKMLLDCLLQARDEGLYSAVTDCGAGGFSSAVGEMGETLGAEVWLDRAPLKYEGLSYTEIWISEAQERMVLAVPPIHWGRLQQLFASEGVEATIIGQFVPTGQLRLLYADQEVGRLSMEFLHGGRPPVIRQADYQPPAVRPVELPQLDSDQAGQLLRQLLGSWNICSKQWIIRQYDHEVQGGSVIKPLVGPRQDAPSDAAVVRPRLDSPRAVVIACGMNPNYGRFDTYHMAASAIDEAVRNVVAVGGDPDRIAILDNFCWGNTERPETLGSLVRAAIACHDVAVAWQTPFISGKDSLNNEFTWVDAAGERQQISIPPSLLISAIGQVDDARGCVTMDLKEPGNLLYLVGSTRQELGGSHATMLLGLEGGEVPQVDLPLARRIFQQLHAAIRGGVVRACHDLSEGGLAVALAEMAFGGELGVEADLAAVCHASFVSAEVAMFSESNSRFICEVRPVDAERFEQLLGQLPCSRLGEVVAAQQLKLSCDERVLLDQPLEQLRQAWLSPLQGGA